MIKITLKAGELYSRNEIPFQISDGDQELKGDSLHPSRENERYMALAVRKDNLSDELKFVFVFSKDSIEKVEII